MKIPKSSTFHLHDKHSLQPVQDEEADEQDHIPYWVTTKRQI